MFLHLCRDNVTTDTVTTIGQVLQPSCCNKFGLGKGFYVVIEFGQGQGILCRDREFLCCKSVSWSDVVTEPSGVVSRQSIFTLPQRRLRSHDKQGWARTTGRDGRA